MRTGLLWALGAWLVAVPVFAQAPPPAPVPPETEVPANPDASAPAPDLLRYWVQAEYLAYWVKNAPLPIALVTGEPANPTQDLLGSNQSLGLFSGFRLGFGAWLDSSNSFGVDGNFFGLLQGTGHVTASSDATGNPTLAFPFTNQTPGAVGDTLLPLAIPGLFAGTVQVTSTLQLWGAEANGLFTVLRAGGFELVALAGFRYVDLRESLTIDTVSSDLLTVPSSGVVPERSVRHPQSVLRRPARRPP